MAITAVVPTALALDTASADLKVSGLTAIDAANTMTFAYPIQGKLILILNNTYAGEKAVTVGVGDFNANGKGTLVIAMAQNAVQYVVLSSDRFKTSAGLVSISFAASMTGFVGALYVP